MAIVLRGRTPCALCGAVIEHGQAAAAFPAFLPAGHRLFAFSDAAFHESCFERWEHREAFASLHARYETLWRSRPLPPDGVPWEAFEQSDAYESFERRMGALLAQFAEEG